MKKLFIVILLLALNSGFSQTKLIFDTDFGGDADDLGALVMLNNFMKKGECELLAVMCWNTEPHAVSAIDAVNKYYGNPEVLVGARKDDAGTIDWQHSKVIADNFPFKTDKKSAPESTKLYRKLLAQSKDQELTIITVGPMLNIKRLLESTADEYSELNGKDLISKKVKEFVIMGGQFPSGEKEWNFDGDMRGVTKYVIENIETPITFLGYEIGLNIKTGEVFNEINSNSPLYKGFYHFSKFCPWLNSQFEGKIYDNSTYDQTAVLYAVRGGLGQYWERIENGKCLPDDKGGNTWIHSENSKHSYLKLLKTEKEMEPIIEAFMLDNF